MIQNMTIKNDSSLCSISTNNLVLFLGFIFFAVLAIPSLAVGQQASKIIFSNDNGAYFMSTDGKKIDRIYDKRLGGISWSPDGCRLCFESDHSICVMESDGSNFKKLSDKSNERDCDPDLIYDSSPIWSPDGKKITFERTKEHSDIWIMNSDGSMQRNLTKTPQYDEKAVSWSPDGKRLLFMSKQESKKWNIFVMNYDGKEQVNLTKSTDFSDMYPIWSPDGEKILFKSNQDGDMDIYIMNADGSNRKNLSNNDFDDDEYTWSPTGTHILFEMEDDIYVMNSDGSHQKNLTGSVQRESHARWSPDGETIVFEYFIGYGIGGIGVIKADGSNRKSLSFSREYGLSFPSWTPSGCKKISVIKQNTFKTSAAAIKSKSPSRDVILYAKSDIGEFYGLGEHPTNYSGRYNVYVSGDGKVVVVGVGDGILEPQKALLWSQGTGKVAIEDQLILSGWPPLAKRTLGIEANDVSADGSVVVGVVKLGEIDPGEPFLWKKTTGMLQLGRLPGGSGFGEAKGISADGSVVVGYVSSSDSSWGEAFRWTKEEGIVSLGDLPGGRFLSKAMAVSANGSVVVGGSYSQIGYEPFIWTKTEGMIGLGFLPGAQICFASAVSADGATVVGNCLFPRDAFIWTKKKGMISLGQGTVALDVSLDGSVVVGNVEKGSQLEAFIWDPSHKLRELKKFLSEEFGLSLAVWQLISATGVSDDGHTIVGVGMHRGKVEAWVVRLTRTIAVVQ